jgi:hypothetical protein
MTKVFEWVEETMALLRVFSNAIDVCCLLPVICLLYFVAASVTHLVAFEVGVVVVVIFRRGFFATRWPRALVAVCWIVATVYRTTEVFVAVEPWAGTDEDAAGEPLRAVITVRSTVVGGGAVVAVRAFGGDANVDADLGLGRGRGSYSETSCSNSRQCKYGKFMHHSPLGTLEGDRVIRGCVGNGSMVLADFE